jgi:hypothetical protein
MMWQKPSATIIAGGDGSLLSQGRREIPPSLSIPAIALYCIWTHGHGSGVLASKAKNGFTMRDVSPAFRFAKPLPAVLRVNLGALPAQ